MAEKILDSNSDVIEKDENITETTDATKDTETEEEQMVKEPETQSESDLDDEDDFTVVTATEEKSEEEPKSEEIPEAEDPKSDKKEQRQKARMEKREKRAEKISQIKEKIKAIATNKKVRIGTGIGAGVLICVYIAGVVFYHNHFYFGTVISGIGCSNMTVEQATSHVKDRIANYTYRLIERGDTEEIITAADIDLKIEFIASLDEPKALQNPWLWCFDFKNRYLPLDINLTMDEAKLEQKVQSLNCVQESNRNMDGAIAGIYFSDDQYFIENDPSRNFIDYNTLLSKVKAGIYGKYSTLNLEEEACYVGISKENRMSALLEKMDNFVKTKIRYMNGEESYLLDGNTIHQWISPTEDYEVYLNPDAVNEWTDRLAAHYDSVGTARPFVTSYGESIEVSGGDYGWIVDSGAEADYLCGVVGNAVEEEREPIFSRTAAVHGASDIGNTYVEVSISAQHVWYYKDGELIVSTDMVSGNPYAGNATDTGVYFLTYKERNATLVGEDYETPVDYWMPFNGGQGLHDATWRGVFGGSIYRGGGSHGCVNLPYRAAAAIYETIQRGDPVVVY